jgi:hypothetical protein
VDYRSTNVELNEKNEYNQDDERENQYPRVPIDSPSQSILLPLKERLEKHDDLFPLGHYMRGA